MKTDVLVIGGGIAGCTAAALLAGAGREVVLLEREAQARHKVCGEFLSAETLRLLPVDVRALGAVPIHAVRLHTRRGGAKHELPFAAMSLTRRTLDEALLAHAARCGAQIRRGAAVESFTLCTPGSHALSFASLQNGERIDASHLFVSTGKHDLRTSPRSAGTQRLTGLKMYYRLQAGQAAALDGHVELHAWRGGYAGLQPVEGGAANLTCLVDRALLRECIGGAVQFLDAMRAVSPSLAQRLQGAQPLLDKPLAIAPIPYGFLRAPTEGAWFLGDQAAVIPSFTGDGMAIAAFSGHLAAKRLLAGETAAGFQRELAQAVRAQVGRAALMARALVSPGFGGPALAALRLAPSLLALAARATRLSAASLAAISAPAAEPVTRAATAA